MAEENVNTSLTGDLYELALKESVKIFQDENVLLRKQLVELENVNKCCQERISLLMKNNTSLETKVKELTEKNEASALQVKKLEYNIVKLKLDVRAAQSETELLAEFDRLRSCSLHSDKVEDENALKLKLENFYLTNSHNLELFKEKILNLISDDRMEDVKAALMDLEKIMECQTMELAKTKESVIELANKKTKEMHSILTEKFDVVLMEMTEKMVSFVKYFGE